ncbi:Putative fatty-acid--CoA ligase [Pseudomonas marincola]|uniref:Putative fatty-acid--CoA ligase n=1 Tax=Pseudomonas marincola TaxID=437900 RepID=A0A653E964_9PSED|nr:AMP-binding protein [Pseudomonas marincola]CAE6920525.1 Putative fatty-acid--CoA ligase [Pseudomonas marincola]
MSQYSDFNLAGLIGNRALRQPEFPVLTVENGANSPLQTRTYAQLWRNGHSMAWGLSQLGLKPGDCFALLMPNHAEFVDAMLAAAITGTVFVPIDPRARGDKLAFFLNNARCKGVIAADYALDNLLAVREQLQQPIWIVALATDDGTADTAEQSLAYAEVFASDTREHPLVALNDASPMQLIFTSGTTGDPKGIVMTHRRYCETALITDRVFGYRADDRPYSGLSLTHANAQLVTLGAALALGMACVLSRKFSKSRLWDICRTYGCTSFTLLGGMTTAVYAEPTRPDDRDNPVRFVVSAGMPQAIWSNFERRFDVQILEFYGAAEGGLTIKPIGVGPTGSIGKPAPNLRHRIVDENGNDCAPGQPGELLFQPVDGSPYKVEYFANPEASAKKCANGWLHMGDVVLADADGWLFFQYRKGSGIRRNGDFINSTFIEKAIAECPQVDDVYVYGIPASNGVPGEKDVVAAVVPKDAANFDAQQIFRACRQQLEANFVPSLLQVLAQIPKTASEKPQERFLLEALNNDTASVHREAR